MCLPHNISTIELNDRCSYAYTPGVNYTFTASQMCPYLSSTIVILLAILTLSVLIFFGVIIYYNCHIRQKGSAPFIPFDCCPTCLFPRKIKMTKVENRLIDENDDDSKEIKTVVKETEMVNKEEKSPTKGVQYYAD